MEEIPCSGNAGLLTCEGCDSIGVELITDTLLGVLTGVTRFLLEDPFSLFRPLVVASLLFFTDLTN